MRPQGVTGTSRRRTPSAGDLDTLFERCSAGDARAREEIIVGFLPYAHHLARRYQGRGEPVDDLCQTASLGLIKAVDRYDPEHSGSFLAFADPTIQGEIRRHFRDTTWPVHVPRSVQDRARRVGDTRERLRMSQGREPSMGAIADDLGLGVRDVAEAEAAVGSRRPESLDATRASEHDERLSLAETVGEPDPGYERVETGLRWRQALRRLPSRDRRALILRFGGGLPQGEIGGRLGLSQMHVSRILRAATAAVAGRLAMD
jgi:RNA polymerase sigma-B factor